MKIALYCGHAATTKETRKHAYSFAKQFFKNRVITLINGKSILSENLNVYDYILVPGGSTSGMIQEITLEGLSKIRQYVEDGGKYIGICAGAYLASKEVNFQTKDLSIQAKRPLGFYKGVSRGPYNEKYHASDDRGFECTKIDILGEKLPVYLNGGGVFVDADSINNTAVLARYADGEAAAVECVFGKGKAYLFAVHLEYQPNLLQESEFISKKDIESLMSFNKKRFDIWRKILNL